MLRSLLLQRFLAARIIALSGLFARLRTSMLRNLSPLY